MEEEIDLKIIIKYFYKRKRMILLIVVGFFLLANLLFLLFKGLIYTSTGKVRTSASANAERILGYKDLLTSDTVVKNAIKNSNVSVDVSKIKNNLSIDAYPGSTVYTITLNYKNKDDSKKICDSIMKEFVNRIESYDGNTAVIYETSVVSDKPVNFNIVKNELLYVGIGCVLAFGYVISIFYLDKRIKGENELRDYNLLGTIKPIKTEVSLIKTKIRLSNLGNVIFLSTPKDYNSTNEVKSLVKEFSKDLKVLFIDTNIRNKSKNIGYSDLLKEYKNNISKYINTEENYDIMETGLCNDEVEVLLSSKSNSMLINDLREKYDYIFLYNSNIVDYCDSLILSKLCDCNYIVIEINRTNSNDLKKSTEMYKQVNVNVDGIIIIDKEPVIKLFGKINI